MQIRQILLGLATSALLAACGPGAAPPAEGPAVQLADPDIPGWDTFGPRRVRVPEGVTLTESVVDGVAVADISGVPENATAAGVTGGVTVVMPPRFENEASGATVRVTVRAMAAEAGSELGVAYTTNEVGNSGWRQFPLTAEPANYSFEYAVPAMRDGKGDFIGLRNYGAAPVRVIGVKTEVLPGPAAPAANP